ncbi:MAG: alpha/beta hydrolase [Rhodovibrionaceae bacterium]
MKFVDVGGVETRCILAGGETAPPLILIHGLSLTADIWMRNIDALSRDFRVAALDMLGHGFTRPQDADGRITVQDKVDHILEFARAMGFERFSISGSSYGGLIAANLYLCAKEKVDKLVINGSGSCFNTEAQLAAFLDRIHRTYRPLLAGSSPQDWRKLLEGTFHDPASIPAEIPHLLCLCYSQDWAVRCWERTIDDMRDLPAFRQYRILERLHEIDLPTLVVWGRNDKGGVYEEAVAAVAKMPNAKLVSIDNCGHLPMVENPEICNEEVLRFLNEKTAADERVVTA